MGGVGFASGGAICDFGCEAVLLGISGALKVGAAGGTSSFPGGVPLAGGILESWLAAALAIGREA